MKLRSYLRRLRRRIRYFGFSRYCDVCGCQSRIFKPYGLVSRANALCSICGSKERDRLTLRVLRMHTDFFRGKGCRLLHIAPELCIAPILAKVSGSGYLSADLLSQDVMQNMDVTSIPYPEDYFDGIYCSHVLEHVPNDIVAMREFYRTLRPGGWAILNVPITADHTVEDLSVTDPDERLQLYGQDDHVRRYGPDYVTRLMNAGFDVKVFAPIDVASADEIVRFGLQAGEAVYYCTKPSRVKSE